jgi:hypothetical protein
LLPAADLKIVCFLSACEGNIAKNKVINRLRRSKNKHERILSKKHSEITGLWARPPKTIINDIAKD